jgi:hypothetical protein
MSERKTSEIKFRITPSEKARWQAAAEGEQVGLSELIRRRVNAVGDARQVADATVSNITDCPGCDDCSCPKDEPESDDIKMLDVDNSQFQTILNMRTEPKPYGWMFEGRSG